MDESYMLFFDVISLVASLYCLVTYFKLRIAGGRLFPNGLLIPKGFEPSDCLDTKGFVAYITPRILIFGVILLIYSIASTLNTVFDLFTPLVESLMMGVSLAFIIWFAVCNGKANRKYWDLDSLKKPPARHL